MLQAEPKGNGHAVLQARPLIGDEPFAMLWGDDIMLGEEPALMQLIKARERLGGGSVIGCIRVGKKDISRYGVVAGTEVDKETRRVIGIVEKPAPEDAPSDLAAVHGYILEPEIFDVLEKQTPGRGGEVWLTDGVSRACAAGRPGLGGRAQGSALRLRRQDRLRERIRGRGAWSHRHRARRSGPFGGTRLEGAARTISVQLLPLNRLPGA